MDSEPHTPPSRDTFTKAPAVAFDPDAEPPEPVRAPFPGEDPPDGLRIGDLGPGGESEPHIRRALLGEPFDDPVAPGSVRCVACAHRCVLRPGRIGICGVRQNRGGRLYTLVYGQVVASKAEPVEKKPFYHFLPGSRAYSVATQGCNFHCAFCQNWAISQAHREGLVPESRQVTPEGVVEEAVAAGVRSIAYTYVEPTVFIEFALDSMVRARAAGLHNLFVTNGYETPEAIELVAPYLDAANVDLKAANDRFYRRVCGARWEPVRDSVVEMRRRGIWLELTTLVIPGLNDDRARSAGHGRVDRHCRRTRDALAPDPLPAGIPPRRTTRPPRPRRWSEARGDRPRSWASPRLRGQCPGGGSKRPLLAPRCGEWLIARADYAVTEWRLVEGRCPRCQHALAGVGLGDSPVVA